MIQTFNAASQIRGNGVEKILDMRYHYTCSEILLLF